MENLAWRGTQLDRKLNVTAHVAEAGSQQSQTRLDEKSYQNTTHFQENATTSVEDKPRAITGSMRRHHLETYEYRRRYDAWLNGYEAALHKVTKQWAQKRGCEQEQAVLQFLYDEEQKNKLKELLAQEVKPVEFQGCSLKDIEDEQHYYIDGTPLPSHKKREIIEHFGRDDDLWESMGAFWRLNGSRVDDIFCPRRSDGSAFKCDASHLACKFWKLVYAGVLPAELHEYVFDQHLKEWMNSGWVNLEEGTLQSNIEFAQEHKWKKEVYEHLPQATKDLFVARMGLEENEENFDDVWTEHDAYDRVEELLEEIEYMEIDEPAIAQAAFDDTLWETLTEELPPLSDLSQLEQHATEVYEDEETPMEVDELPLPAVHDLPLPADQQLSSEQDLPLSAGPSRSVPRRRYFKKRQGKEPVNPHEEQDWFDKQLPAKIQRLNWYHSLMYKRRQIQLQEMRAQMRLQYFIAKKVAEDVYDKRVARMRQERREASKKFAQADASRETVKMISIGDDFVTEIPQAQAEAEQEIVQKEENVTFVDMREQVQETGYVSGQSNATAMHMSLAEDEWTVRNIMKKPLPFGSVQWAVGDALDKHLVLATRTKSLIQVPGNTLIAQHENLLRTFTFFRGHPKIRVQINGTKFHCGRLLVRFIPRFSHTKYDDAIYETSTSITAPNGMLDASYSNSVVLELPFVHSETYFNTSLERAWQTLGTLELIVFNRLKAATAASQSLSITCWVSWEQCELHQPTTMHDLKLPKAQASLLAAGAAEGLAKSVLPKVQATLGDVLGASTNQDKPADPVEISRWVPNSVTSLCYGEGLDKSSRLGLNPMGFTIPSADIISTTQDDMNLLELCKLPCRINLTSWGKSNTIGIALATIPVCPNLAYSSDATKEDVVFAPTMLAYCSRAFKFWRGSLEYTVQVIASQMHSGRLIISYLPAFSGTNFSDHVASNTLIMDLQEKSEVKFKIDFLSERPWKRCDKLFTKLSTDETNENAMHTGWLKISVLNQLVAPDNVSADVDINVLVQAGPDFELAVPSDLYCCSGIGKLAPPKAQAGQENVTQREDEGVMSLTKGMRMISMNTEYTIGENCMDLKTLLRRYTLAYTNSALKASPNRHMIFPNTPNLTSVNAYFNSKSGVQSRTTLSHFSQLFTYWRGSLRYKIVFASTAVTQMVEVFHIPGVHATPQWDFSSPEGGSDAFYEACSAYGTQIATQSLQNSIEFEVPFYTPFTQLEVSVGEGEFEALNTTGSVVVFINNREEYSSNRLFKLYQAAGDDFVLSYLRAPPIIQFRDEGYRWISNNATSMYEPSHLPVPKDVTPKAQGFADWFKPEAFKKIERVSDKMESLLTSADKAVTAAVSAIRGTKGCDDIEAGEDDEEADGDDQAWYSQMMGPVKTMVTSMVAQLASMPQLLKECWDQCSITVTDYFSKITDIVTSLTSFITATNVFVKACALVTLIKVMVGTAADKIKESATELIRKVLNFFDPQDAGRKLNEPARKEPKAQAGLDFEPVTFVSAIAAALAVAASVIGLSKLPSTKDCLDMVRNISERLRLFNFATLALSNVPKLYNAVKESFQYVIEWIVSKVNPDWLPALSMVEGFEEVEEFCKFMDQMKEEGIPIQDRVNYDQEFRNKVNCMVDRAKKYRQLIVKGKLKKEGALLIKYTEQAMEMAKEVQHAQDTLPSRKDPFCVAFTGKTGLGKSGIVTNAAATCLDALGYAHHNRWCAVNCNEKFFTENYSQQAAVYFDDFSQFVSEDQYLNFFNLKSNTAYPLNMAFKKGEYFNSDFIFMTTNIPYPSPNFLNCNEAFLRRRDMLIEVDWANEAVAALAATGVNVLKFDGSHAKFRILNSVDPARPPGPWTSYAGICREMIKRSWTHLDIQRKKVFHDLTAQKYVVAEPGPFAYKFPDHLRFGHETDAQFEAVRVPAAQALMDEVVFDPAHSAATQIWRWERAQNKQVTGYSKKLNIEACIMHDYLGIFPDELWPEVEWNGVVFTVPIANHMQQTYLDLIAKAAQQTAYKVPWEYHRVPHQYFMEQCAEHEYSGGQQLGAGEPNDDLAQGARIEEEQNQQNETAEQRVQTRWQATKKALCEMKTSIWTKIKQYFTTAAKWMKPIAELLVLFIICLVTYSVLACVFAYGIHKCLCATLRWFHFRCGVCGKWPELGKDVNHAAWIQSQWRTLYGDRPYEAGYVTAIEEEAHIKQCRGDPAIRKLLTGTAEAQGAYSSTDVKGQPLARVFATGEISAQGGAQVNIATETALDVISRSQYRIGTNYTDGRANIKMSALAVGGRKLMCPAHFFSFMEEGDEWSILHDSVWMPLVFDKQSLTVVSGKDVAFYELPVRFHQHKSLARHFICENELAQRLQTSVTLTKLGKDNRQYVFIGEAKAEKEVRYEFEIQDQTTPILAVGVYTYNNIPTQAGDCGAILMSTKKSTAPKVLGMHVCATDKKGWSTLITRELIEKHVLAHLGTPVPAAEARVTNLVPPGHFGRVGTVKKGVFQNSKTTIIPTEIQGLIRKPVTEPAVLTVHDERMPKRVNPLRKGIEKYSTIASPFPQKDIALITEALAAEVDRFPRLRGEIGPLEMEQVINGVEDVEGYLKMPMDTSPGWPYVNSRPQEEKGKAYLFDLDTGSLKDPDLIQRFRDREIFAGLGQRVESVWIDCLKDERRALEKIRSGSTRVFTIPPVDFTLLVRKYTLDFAESVRASRAFSFCQVGTDPQSLEWTALYSRLSAKSPKCVAGDFSRFDGTMPPELIVEVFKLIYYYYTGTFDTTAYKLLWNVLMTIADEIIHTVQLAKDQIYVTHIGNPSGNPLTVIINSFINFYYMALAWLELARIYSRENCSLAKFFEHVEMVAYGDDNLLAIKDEVIEWFNQETISKYLEQFGIVYTNEEKSGITKYKEISKCTFLKNGFGRFYIAPNVMVPLMKQDTIYELLNWTREAPEQDELLLSNIHDSLRFAYFYGPTFFRELRDQILVALREVGKNFRVMTFADYNQWFLHTCGMM